MTAPVLHALRLLFSLQYMIVLMSPFDQLRLLHMVFTLVLCLQCFQLCMCVCAFFSAPFSLAHRCSSMRFVRPSPISAHPRHCLFVQSPRLDNHYILQRSQLSVISPAPSLHFRSHSSSILMSTKSPKIRSRMHDLYLKHKFV